MLGTTTFDGLATWCRAIKHGHGAGLPLTRVFEMQAKNGPAALRPVATRIVAKLERGDSLEEVLAAEGPNLPELFISMAAVGERSGRIPEVFAQLEDYYRLQGQMRREFRSQAIRPAVMFVGAVLVIAFTIFVLGQLAPEGTNPSAPIGFGLTGASGAILFLIVVGSVVGGLILAYKLMTNTVAKQATFEAWLLRWPVLGPCVRASALSRFCLAMRLTLDSSMSPGKALKLSLRATGNGAFQAQADRIGKHVAKGRELAPAIGMSPVFPSEFIATIQVGEESGQIPEVMARQAEHYREETDRRTKALTRMLSGGVYALVSLFIIVAIFRMAHVLVPAGTG
jgi:type II secretory pathway component PulF